MPLNFLHAQRTSGRLIVICGLAVGLALWSSTVSAQFPPPTVYDDGLTRINPPIIGLPFILRDNPNPPPNPTTVILTDGFTLGPNFGDLFELEGSSVLDIRGGRLEDGGSSVDLFDTSHLLMSGGEIRATNGGPGIRAGGSSRTEISEGRLRVGGNGSGSEGSGIRLTDNAQLEISGGELTAFSTPIIDSRGASRVTISGGSFRAAGDRVGSVLAARGSSVVDVLGGTFISEESNSGISAFDDAVINVRGGSFSFPFIRSLRTGFNTWGSGPINVFGNNFALDGSPVGPGLIPFDGRLTGVLADGTPLDVLATGRVFLVPEPAAWLLASVALALPWRRGRRQ